MRPVPGESPRPSCPLSGTSWSPNRTHPLHPASQSYPVLQNDKRSPRAYSCQSPSLPLAPRISRLPALVLTIFLRCRQYGVPYHAQTTPTSRKAAQERAAASSNDRRAPPPARRSSASPSRYRYRPVCLLSARPSGCSLHTRTFRSLTYQYRYSIFTPSGCIHPSLALRLHTFCASASG